MLIALLLFIFTVSGTFFFNKAAYNYIGWYMTLYFIAAYIRLYPNKWTESRVAPGAVLAITIVLAWLSIVVVDFVGVRFGFEDAYYMVSDSHKLFALVIGLSAFLLFKNLRIPQSGLINSVAATTFGVLLIHANSDAMRTFLWKDLLRVPEMYGSRIGVLVLHAAGAMFGVFAVCSAIDYLRIQFLEKSVMDWILARREAIEDKVMDVLRQLRIS